MKRGNHLLVMSVSVLPFAYVSVAATERIFVKIDVGEFCENLSGNSKC